MHFSNHDTDLRHGQGATPAPSGGKHAIFTDKPVEELEIFSTWRQVRSVLVAAGEIQKTTFANEERTLKRFLKYINNLGTDWPSTDPNLIGEKDRARLGDGFLNDPFRNPLPVVSGFLSQLESATSVSSAKAIIKGFLPLANKDFDLETLDYLTPTPKHTKHPAVESWLKQHTKSDGLEVNYRHRTKRLLEFVAEKYLDSELHKLDMQDELAALTAIKSGATLSRQAQEKTLIGVIVSHKATIVAEYFEAHPERDDKHHRSAIALFLESLDSKNTERPKATKVALPEARAARTPPKANESKATERNTPPPIGRARKIKRAKVEEIPLPPKGGPYGGLTIPRPPLSPARKDFIAAAQKRQKAGHYGHLGLGREVEIALAMRDEILSLMRKPRTGEHSLNGTPQQLANLKFSEVITDDGYKKLDLPDVLAEAFPSYRASLGIPFFKPLIDQGEPPVFFVIEDGNPIEASPEAIAELLESLQEE